MPSMTTMQFSSWSEFFQMGGYALYVWTSYGITVTVLVAIVLLPWLRHRRLRRDLVRRERRDQRLKKERK